MCAEVHLRGRALIKVLRNPREGWRKFTFIKQAFRYRFGTQLNSMTVDGKSSRVVYHFYLQILIHALSRIAQLSSRISSYPEASLKDSKNSEALELNLNCRKLRK